MSTAFIYTSSRYFNIALKIVSSSKYPKKKKNVPAFNLSINRTKTFLFQIFTSRALLEAEFNRETGLTLRAKLG